MEEKIMFSLNQYDEHGDKFDDCILIYMSKTNIIRLENIEHLDRMIQSLQRIKSEIVAMSGIN